MKPFIRITALLITAFVLVSCNLPSSRATATPNAEQIYTAAAQTVSASITKIAPTATRTPLPRPTATRPPQVSPSAVQPTVIQATTAPSVACDQAEFVSDVTIPDDTVITPGANFTKTWRLANVGSCAWTTSYRLVYVDGDLMGGPTEVNLPSSVGPGQTVDLSISFKAPDEAKTYQGYWKLKNASGSVFGLKSNNNGPFWVKIKVGGSTAFSVTGANLSIDNSAFTGTCPHTYNLIGTVTASAAGKVTYFWEFNDGSRSAQQELNFTAAGGLPVSYSWSLDSPGDYWVKLYVDQPNKQYFPQANFSLTCSP